MSERVSNLFLPPYNADERGFWFVGAAPPLQECYVLRGRPDRHETFSSLIALFESLSTHVSCAALTAELLKVCESGDRHRETQGAFLSSFVSKSIIRRISRESVHTAPLIEKAARLLLKAVDALGEGHVFVPDVDRLDRPTLKVLARAVVCQTASMRVRWSFGSVSDPSADIASSDIYKRSRSELLTILRHVTRSEVRYVGQVRDLERTVPAAPVPLASISHALVFQNYDAVFLWAEPYLNSADAAERVEALRLMSLAAANVGARDRALGWLAEAEQLSAQASKKAELAYLQGLLAAKRDYDLAASDAHYARALDMLSRDTGDLPASKELATAWLYNGMALNEAVRSRRERSGERLDRAGDLLRDSLRLVREGDDPDRHYLRSNLIANAAFLYEMRGAYDSAIEILESAFDFPVEGGIEIRRRMSSTLGYRIGVLQFKNGQAAAALETLGRALKQHNEENNWSVQEKILRALGCIHLEMNNPRQAEAVFSEGLRLCCAARARQGAAIHAGGLLRAAGLQPDSARRRRNLARRLRSRGLTLSDCAPDTVPSPKLPAYIPEIDLEEIPLIDINRFLGGAEPIAASKSVWRTKRCA